MKYRIANCENRNLHEINKDQDFHCSFELNEAGFIELHLAARSESDWECPDYESAFVRIYVNGDYNQDCVLFYGNRLFTYSRLLGSFAPGQYHLRIEFRREESSPQVKRAFIQSIKVNVVTFEDPLSLLYQHTPIFYGRNLKHPFESRFTDTPLLLFYSTWKENQDTWIEYQILFSHEDEGTPAPALMAKWGRTTDIEWAYRVRLNEARDVIQAEYHGPRHIITSFAGRYSLGGHPILQVATANGNVSDQVTSEYRFLFPPLTKWDRNSEARERVMDVNPFTYQVAAWEMNRQMNLEKPVNPDSVELADARNYLYVQAGSVSNTHPQAYVDFQVRLLHSDKWYSSSFHNSSIRQFRLLYQGSSPYFATTVKLPEGASVEDLAEICAVWRTGGAEQALIPGFRVLMLDEDYMPGKVLESTKPVEISNETPIQRLWIRTI